MARSILLLVIVQLAAIIVEAAVTNLAELIGVHTGVRGDLVHLLHGRGVKITCAAVDEGTIVSVLPSLAVVVDKLELWLVGIVLTDDIPVFPEFCYRMKQEIQEVGIQ